VAHILQGGFSLSLPLLLTPILFLMDALQQGPLKNNAFRTPTLESSLVHEKCNALADV
jgi:hypothetical protein